MENGLISAFKGEKGQVILQNGDNQLNKNNSVFVNDLIDLSDFNQTDISGGKMYHSDEPGRDYSSEPVFNGDHNRSILDSPLTPSKDYSPTTGPKYLTTNALASHLYRGRPGGGSTRSSRRASFGSDDLESVSASDPGGVVVSPEELTELNNRVEKIKQQLEQQRETDDKYVRLKQENAVLREKLNSFEEQMLVNEDKWRAQLADSEKKYRELLAHADREKVLELDAMVLRHRLLERDHEQCTSEREKILQEMEQLRRKCTHLEEVVVDSQQELEASENSRKSGETKLWKEKEETEKRLRKAVETCEELRREIDRLQNERGRVDVTASELEEELQRLKEEQKRLRETNDELHAELLHASVEHGRKLLSANSPSLAEEMDRMSKDQVMEALRDQEIVNKKITKLRRWDIITHIGNVSSHFGN